MFWPKSSRGKTGEDTDLCGTDEYHSTLIGVGTWPSHCGLKAVNTSHLSHPTMQSAILDFIPFTYRSAGHFPSNTGYIPPRTPSEQQQRHND